MGNNAFQSSTLTQMRETLNQQINMSDKDWESASLFQYKMSLNRGRDSSMK